MRIYLFQTRSGNTHTLYIAENEGEEWVEVKMSGEPPKFVPIRQFFKTSGRILRTGYTLYWEEAQVAFTNMAALHELFRGFLNDPILDFMQFQPDEVCPKEKETAGTPSSNHSSP